MIRSKPGTSLPALLVCILLLLAGGLETLERHDHASLAPGHDCPACRLAGAPADLPMPDGAGVGVRPSGHGSVLPVLDPCAPEAPCCAVLHLRGPPLT
jgi:hypothetical protein